MSLSAAFCLKFFSLELENLSVEVLQLPWESHYVRAFLGHQRCHPVCFWVDLEGGDEGRALHSLWCHLQECF